MGFWDIAGDVGKGALGRATGGGSLLIPGLGIEGADTKNIPGMPNIFGDPGADAEKLRKQQLYGQSAQAGDFANTAQGNYNNMTAQGNAQLQALRDLQSGKNSVSAEQLRQGLQQNL